MTEDKCNAEILRFYSIRITIELKSIIWIFLSKWFIFLIVNDFLWVDFVINILIRSNQQHPFYLFTTLLFINPSYFKAKLYAFEGVS